MSCCVREWLGGHWAGVGLSTWRSELSTSVDGVCVVHPLSWYGVFASVHLLGDGSEGQGSYTHVGRGRG